MELKREYVSLSPAAHLYDTLLDAFQPGTSTADVQAIFAILLPQVELIRAIGARPQAQNAFLLARSPRESCGASAWTSSRRWGSTGRGRQDRSVHPFATGIGPDDVRITTRYVERQPLALIFGTIDETGHALDQGINRDFARGALGSATSLGVHESQSRLWENIVDRIRSGFFPAWQRRFPSNSAAFRWMSSTAASTWCGAIRCVEDIDVRPCARTG